MSLPTKAKIIKHNSGYDRTWMLIPADRNFTPTLFKTFEGAVSYWSSDYELSMLVERLKTEQLIVGIR